MMRAKWEADLVRLGGLPEKPLGVEVGGCTCQRFDSETKKCTYGHAPCRYHEAATRQPWNHRIAWNCPTFWDGCNCEGGPYFYTADADTAAGLADEVVRLRAVVVEAVAACQDALAGSPQWRACVEAVVSAWQTSSGS